MSAALCSQNIPDFVSVEKVCPRDLAMSVYYHYTSHEGLTGILDAEMILPSLPHPATPGILAGESIVKSVGAVFLTRMDPSNSKEAIAFNNYR